MRKLKIDERKSCAHNFHVFEQEFNKLSKFVMESKKFERFAFWSIIVFYVYIAFHIAYWVGRNLL